MATPYYNTLTEEQYNQLTEAQYDSLPEQSVSRIQDGTIVLDQHNQQYKYDARLNQWVFIGPLIPHQIVNLQAHGLITPAILQLLEGLEAKHNQCKVWPLVDAYYYMLRSGDRMLQIRPDAGQITIEIDSNLLTRRMLAFGKGCPQSPGPTGLAGKAGASGQAGPREGTYAIQPGSLATLSRTVRTPLDTPISLRLLLEGVQQIEILYYLGSGGVQVNYTQGFERRLVDPQIQFDQGLLTARLQFQEGQFEAGWTYRVRQLGPTGFDGVDGDPFIQIRELSVSDPKVCYNRATRIVRANKRDNLFHIGAEFTNLISICGHLRLNQSFAAGSFNPELTLKPRPDLLRPCCKTLEEEEPDYWCGVEPTIDGGKGMHRWGLDKEKYDPGKLDEPAWEPNAEPSNSVYVPYNWFDNAKLPELPFEILYSKRPQPQTGEVELFHCPNIGQDQCGPTQFPIEEGAFGGGEIGDVG